MRILIKLISYNQHLHVHYDIVIVKSFESAATLIKDIMKGWDCFYNIDEKGNNKQKEDAPRRRK